MDNIFKILDTASKEERILDETNMHDIIFELYKIYCLQDKYSIYIKKECDFEFPCEGYICGAFFPCDGICMYTNDIKLYCDMVYIKNKELFNKLSNYDKYMLFNIRILNFLNHEYEHLLYEQDYNFVDSYFEEKLMDMEYEYFALGDIYSGDTELDDIEHEKSLREDVYENNYYISFVERIANINAYKRTNKFLKEHEDRMKFQLLLNEKALLNFESFAYNHNLDNPTKRFFVAIGKEKEFNEFDISDFTYEEKLRYGLRLSYNDTINKHYCSLELEDKLNSYLKVKGRKTYGLYI